MIGSVLSISILPLQSHMAFLFSKESSSLFLSILGVHVLNDFVSLVSFNVSEFSLLLLLGFQNSLLITISMTFCKPNCLS